MVPQADIVAWRQVAPWADDGMVEQDLILSRALIEIFSDVHVAGALAFRGGTALHKLVLSPSSRYSLIRGYRSRAGPPWSYWRSLDGIRDRLAWLGEPARDRTETNVTLLFRFDSEIPPVRRLRLKIEIQTREHFSAYGHVTLPHSVSSRVMSRRPRILTPSIRPCGPTQDRRWISKKPRASLRLCGVPAYRHAVAGRRRQAWAAALPNIVW
jgi:hypothetical protein